MSSVTQYQSLLLEYTPRPITSEREYRRALKYLDQYMQPKPGKARAQLLDLIATLVSDYEDKHHADPLNDLSPGELLSFLIEQRGLTRAELARLTDIPRQKITNAINGTRSLSKSHAIKLAEFFKLRPAAFVADTSSGTG